MRSGKCKAAVYQMSGEFGLCILICVLAVEIGGPYESAFLPQKSISRS